MMRGSEAGIISQGSCASQYIHSVQKEATPPWTLKFGIVAPLTTEACR